jgi:signal transduction histidine kinase
VAVGKMARRAGFALWRHLSLEESAVSHMSEDEPQADGTEQRLRALLAEQETRLTEIAELVAHVRHEINNPLTGVLGQAQLLLREELSESARRRVVTIEQLAGRIRDTVAQLREVQRPQQPYNGNDEGETSEPPRH